MQLKILRHDGWYLVPTEDFTEEELAPLKENMKRANLAILEPGEKVRILPEQYSKTQILEVLASI